MSDIDTVGWTLAEITAWRWYEAVVDDLTSKPKLSFYEARLLVDAYAAWVEIFDPPRARYHLALMRQQIARREFAP